ncbi:MAG TPA: hypothetical protein VKU87_07185, partial [Thermomicrobiaceae bacterium]|nr:hypothetical protein [Thermomicrobiaceae bacterium]
MHQTHHQDIDSRIHQAVSELRALISENHLEATFTVGPGGDNPEGTYLTVEVDLEDPDEVLDLVIERVLDMQFNEGIPVHV